MSIISYGFDNSFSNTIIEKEEVPADTLPVRCLTALVATMPVPASPSGGQTGTAFRCEDTGIFTSRQYFGQNVFQFPTVFFRSNQIVEFGHHFGGIVVGSRIYGEHTRCVTNAQHLFACYLPMYITCKSCQELDVFDVRFVVQNSLVQMRNAPSQRDVIDK